MGSLERSAAIGAFVAMAAAGCAKPPDACLDEASELLVTSAELVPEGHDFSGDRMALSVTVEITPVEEAMAELQLERIRPLLSATIEVPDVPLTYARVEASGQTQEVPDVLVEPFSFSATFDAPMIPTDANGGNEDGPFPFDPNGLNTLFVTVDNCSALIPAEDGAYGVDVSDDPQ